MFKVIQYRVKYVSTLHSYFIRQHTHSINTYYTNNRNIEYSCLVWIIIFILFLSLFVYSIKPPFALHVLFFNIHGQYSTLHHIFQWNECSFTFNTHRNRIQNHWIINNIQREFKDYIFNLFIRGPCEKIVFIWWYNFVEHFNSTYLLGRRHTP